MFNSPDDDIDDDAFLNHPRAGSSGYMLPQHSRPSSVMSLEERQRQILMKKREIEEETLKSSDRSLGLLFESEKVGAATAEELGRQKETLLRTEGRLDEINHTLKVHGFYKCTFHDAVTRFNRPRIFLDIRTTFEWYQKCVWRH